MITSPFLLLVPAGEHRREESLPNEGTVEMSLDGHSEGWVETGDGLAVKYHDLVFGSGEQISSRQHREAETYETVLPGSITENGRGPTSTASLRHMDAHPQSCACGKFPSPFRILNSPHHWGALSRKLPANSNLQALWNTEAPPVPFTYSRHTLISPRLTYLQTC